MTTYGQFSKRCKMRHDFGDQIQVRFHHDDGEQYDTWVSGSEALARLEAVETEEQIKALSELDLEDVRIVAQSLPKAAKNAIRRSLRDGLADRLQAGIGGNLIGNALAEAVRGRSSSEAADLPESDRWQALMRFEPFRQQVLKLAWIQVEGSFPDLGSGAELDDWL